MDYTGAKLATELDLDAYRALLRSLVLGRSKTKEYIYMAGKNLWRFLVLHRSKTRVCVNNLKTPAEGSLF